MNTCLTDEQKYLLYLIPKLDPDRTHRILEYVKENPAQPKPDIRLPSSLSKSFHQLMSMTGCISAKKLMVEIVSSFRMSMISQARKNVRTRSYYHMAFIGNPGCAKTTCARLFAKILFDEGITRNSAFAEITRSAICGRYAGHTAANVKSLFRKNAGGVMFIDEAYSLSNVDDAFGTEAINEIIVGLEQYPDTVVIFAGYPDEMHQFLSSNPGLKSRIPYQVEFPDYSTEELIEITKNIAEEKGFTITDSAMAKLYGYYDSIRTDKDFGNGRICRNLVEAAICQKSLNIGLLDNRKIRDCLDSSRFPDDVLFSLDDQCFVPSSLPDLNCSRSIGF